MASVVSFNGRVTSTPGSYTQVDTSGLGNVALGASGIVAVLGEAVGGSPYNGDTPVHSITNPAKLPRLFHSGSLLDAGYMVFNPSRDDQIPGGAQQMKAVKVNPAVRATLALQDEDGVDTIDVTSVDYGAFTDDITVAIATGSIVGKAVTVKYGDITEVFDDIAGDPVMETLFVPGSDGPTRMTIELSPLTAVVANWEKDVTGAESEYIGAIDSTTLIAEKDNDITVGETVDVVSDNAGDTTQTVTIYGVNQATGLPDSEDISLNGTTTASGSTTWSAVHGVIMDGTAAGTVTISDAGDSDTLFDIAAGDTTAGIDNFSANPISCANSTITLTPDATTADDVLLIGEDDGGTPTIELLTMGTSGVAVESTTEWSQLTAIATGYLTAGTTLTTGGLLLDENDVVSVVSDDNTDNTQTVTIYGLDNSDGAQTETISLNGTTPVSGSANWNKIFAAVLSANTSGNVTVSCATPTLKVFEWDGSASLYRGFTPLDNAEVDGGGNVTVTPGVSSDRECLIVGFTSGPTAAVEKITFSGTGGITGSTSFIEVTGIASGHIDAGSTAVASAQNFSLAQATYSTVAAMSAAIGAIDGWTASAIGTSGTTTIASLDALASTNALVTRQFGNSKSAIISRINTESELISMADSGDGTNKAPVNISDTNLSGGSEGTATFADWQAALDLIRDEFVNTVVVMTDDEAVQAAVISHCVYMAGAGRQERDCILGAPSGTTKSEAKSLISDVMNSRHARCAIQDVVRFNTAGTRTQFAPYYTAAIAAGMQAGSPVGTSLTFKYVNVLDVIGDDASYNPTDDSDDLINMGALILTRKPNVGWRWLRNVTTYLADDNAAYTEAAVNEAVNFAVYNFRERMEEIVGQPAFEGTLNAALSNAVAILNDMVDLGVITTWRALTIEIDGDTMRVDVEIAPIQSVNFVLSTLHLVSATVSAAA